MAATASGKDKLLRHSRIYVGGYDLSGDTRTFGGFDNTFTGVDCTGLDDTVRNYLSNSRRQTGVNGVVVMMNDTSGRSWDQLKDTPNTSILTVGFGGGGLPVVPDPAYLMPTHQLSDVASFDSEKAILTTDFVYDSGQYDVSDANPLGVILQGAASISATQNGASHDNEGSTASGWHANLHVLTTASGNFALTIEHSTDDSAWATLGTFTSTAGSVESEQLTGTGTVNQYTRFVMTRTAGTVTVVCAFARN